MFETCALNEYYEGIDSNKKNVFIGGFDALISDYGINKERVGFAI
jgi:hypothetical protein